MSIISGYFWVIFGVILKSMVKYIIVWCTNEMKLVLAWREIHRDKLMGNWYLAERHEMIKKIEPLR